MQTLKSAITIVIPAGTPVKGVAKNGNPFVNVSEKAAGYYVSGNVFIDNAELLTSPAKSAAKDAKPKTGGMTLAEAKAEADAMELDAKERKAFFVKHGLL